MRSRRVSTPKKVRPGKRSLQSRFSTPEDQPRLRIICETVGPGKAQLLELIEKTRSISDAARAMKMSYPRAWNLVEGLNQSFARPLVDSSTGGLEGGGSRLTADGRTVLKLYRRIQARCRSANRADLIHLHRLLRR